MESYAGLLLREKLAVFVILFILATIASLSYSSKHQRIAQTKQYISVHCVGAIDKECWLNLPLGAQVADLLAQVTLSEDADTNKLVLEARLTNDQTFVVPKKGVLTLYVTGAVQESGCVYVPEGLKYSQLREYLLLRDDADSSIFRRRRRVLCEGETVEVGQRSEICARK